MVQTKEERRLYKKEYRAKNREKIREQMREYRATNKEAIKEHNREYRDTNKEAIKEQNREYRATNKGAIKEYKKQHYQTPAGIKSRTLSNWKSRGVIGDLSTLYDERYLPSTACEVCKNTYSSTFDRCLDHDHSTGEFRQILCQSCNIRDNWKKTIEIEI